MKIISNFMTMTLMVFLCAAPFVDFIAAGPIEFLTIPIMGRLDSEGRTSNFDQEPSLTFNFSGISLGSSSDLSNFSRGVFFTERPRIFVSTPNGKVFSKPINDDFSILNNNVGQTVQIVISNPRPGAYILGIEMPQATLPVDAFINIDTTSVFASRDNSLTTLVNPSTFVSLNQQTQANTFFVYGSSCSKIP